MSYDVLDERSPADASGQRPAATDRLLVTVRTPEDPRIFRHRLYRHVGMLTRRLDAGYTFAYCDGAGADPEILPLLGFPDFSRTYTSQDMFPLFAQRIMSARRPDRLNYLDALDLVDGSEPWEVLSRSGGRRVGDAIEVIPEPTVAEDGSTRGVFLVHGIRYRGTEASDAIARLSTGDQLQLCLDENNPVNERAVLVCSDGTQLGYVPDPLVEYVRKVVESGGYRLTVLRANGPEVGPHLRLLVELSGSVPIGYQPFD